ncbi:MAG: carbohydrate porin [Nitrospinae bacterium]|nr:carbohydrate porin [Nitrospinota bacterium]
MKFFEHKVVVGKSAFPILFMAFGAALFPSPSVADSNSKIKAIEEQLERITEELEQEKEHRRNLEKLIEELTIQGEAPSPTAETSPEPMVNPESEPPAGAEGELLEGETTTPLVFSEEKYSRGPEFTGGLTGILQGSSKTARGDGQTNASAVLDMEIVYSQNDIYYLIIGAKAWSGRGLDPALATDIPVNYGAERLAGDKDEGIIISHAYLEGLFLEKRFIISAGKMDVSSLFDENILAGSEKTAFVSGAFNRASGIVGKSLEPLFSPALRIILTPAPWAEFQAIYAHSGFDHLERNPYLVAQLSFRPSMGGLEGNYRFYYVSDGREYHDLGGAETRSNRVMGLSFDQFVTDHMGFFLRYATTDDTIKENRVASMASGGLTFSGGLWGRWDDLIGIGYARLGLNDNIDNSANSDGQTALEIYYNARLNPMIAITPDVQLHSNLPTAQDRDITIVALRAQMDF